MHAQPRHRPQSRSGRRWVDAVLVSVLVTLVVAGAAAVISGRYQLRPVLSGSMRPGLPVGGIVITERIPVSSLQVRDVVVFHSPESAQELIVHRIISLTRGPSGPVVKTQGDANTAPDPWTVTLQGKVAYRAIYTLPLLGYVAVWAHGPSGRVALVLVGLLLLLGAIATGMVSQRRASRSPTRRDGRRSPTQPVPPDLVDVDSAN